MPIEDMDNDGIISSNDLELNKIMQELERAEEKANAQKNMAWIALIMTVFFTGLLFTPIIPVERITALSNVLDWFYITQASIVCGFMGVTAYANRK
jgi:hypothetical protein